MFQMTRQIAILESTNTSFAKETADLKEELKKYDSLKNRIFYDKANQAEAEVVATGSQTGPSLGLKNISEED